MTIHWKAVEKDFFSVFIVGNFETFINFGLSVIKNEKINNVCACCEKKKTLMIGKHFLAPCLFTSVMIACSSKE